MSRCSYCGDGGAASEFIGRTEAIDVCRKAECQQRFVNDRDRYVRDLDADAAEAAENVGK